MNEVHKRGRLLQIGLDIYMGGLHSKRIASNHAINAQKSWKESPEVKMCPHMPYEPSNN
jgi:hypothetical protein